MRIILVGGSAAPGGLRPPSDVNWEMSGILGYEYIWCIFVKIVVKDEKLKMEKRLWKKSIFDWN
jgi:hypothetical protein